MKVACYHADSVKTVAQAFAAGVIKEGEDAHVLDSNRFESSTGYDAAAFYGMSPKHELIWNNFRANGKPVISMDLGYWGRRPAHQGYGYLKVSVNNLHPTSYFQKVKHPADRFSIFAASVTPMRKSGNHILLAAVGPKSSVYYKMEHQSWDRAAVQAIRKATKRTIIYRAKPHHEKTYAPIPGTVWSDAAFPVKEILENAWCVVTHHSNVAVNGLVMGIPCFVKEGIALPAAETDLSKIEDPKILNTQDQIQLLSDVAYTQWSVPEMSQGYCWAHLRREVLPK